MIKLKGLDKVLRNIDRIQKDNLRAASEAVSLFIGEDIMGDARDRAPSMSGALRGSGYVASPDHRGAITSVEIGFGGPAKDYAVVIHEDLTLQHTNGQGKFLESARDTRARGALRRSVRAGEEALKRGRTSQRTKFPTDPGGTQ